MGDPKRFRRKYSTPSHPWNKARIEAERELAQLYGLQNKKEQWRMNSILKRYKDQAKKLIADTTKQGEKEKKQMVEKLVRYGLVTPNAELDDILGIDIKNVMERRLQTLVFRRGLARTPKQARQFIVHRHITIGDKKITSPSYLVSKEEEPLIAFTAQSPLHDEAHPERLPTESEEIKKELEKTKPKDSGKTKKQGAESNQKEAGTVAAPAETEEEPVEQTAENK
jgi:small subunit ribosomal protein S4